MVLCRTDMKLSCPMSGSRLLVMSSTVTRDLVSVSHYCGHHLTYDAALDKCRGEGDQSNLSGDQQISTVLESPCETQRDKSWLLTSPRPGEKFPRVLGPTKFRQLFCLTSFQLCQPHTEQAALGLISMITGRC